jgi:hypothetical protein
LGDLTKEDDRSETCSDQREMSKKDIKFQSENLKGKERLGEPKRRWERKH